MKPLVIILLFSIALGCRFSFAQNLSEENKPEEKIEVNKEFDEYGNLIRYDSTYVYSYSNKNTEIVSKDLDSVLKNFLSNRKSHFLDNSFNINDFMFPKHFSDLDSILKQRMKMNHDFFDDFFEFNKSSQKDSIAPNSKKPNMNEI